MSSPTPSSSGRAVCAAAPPLPPENLYGHTKKLRYILAAIDRRQAALGRPVRVLDFGCGNGEAVSRYIIGRGVDYWGVDVHEPSLAHARRRFGSERARFLAAAPGGVAFDLVVYADFLEHVPDPGRFLAAHARLLAPGGLMVGSVPNGYGPFEIEQRIDRWLRLSRGLAALSRAKRRFRGQADARAEDALPYNSDSGHVVFFTRAMLERCAGAAGLRVADFANGAFLGASLSGIVLARSPRFIAWNARIADRLPWWMVSTWYFTLEPAER